MGSAVQNVAGAVPIDNVTVTLGKFSVANLFDTNTYAHDRRADFLNWSLIDASALDYAADGRGFTYGAAVEWTVRAWTVHGGVFQLSRFRTAK